MAEVIITREIAFVGMKVKRGRDWYYSNQDISDGKTGVGVIVDLIVPSYPGWIYVSWKPGEKFMHRVGEEEKFDLYLWTPESTPTTIKAPDPQSPYLDSLKSTTGLKVGDKLRFVKHTSDSSKGFERANLSPDSILEIESIIGTRIITLKGGSSWSFVIDCFKKATDIEITREELSVLTKLKDKPTPIIRISERGWALWEPLDLKVGQRLFCIKEFKTNDGIIREGEVVVISETSSSKIHIKIEGRLAGMWASTCNFVPAGSAYLDSMGIMKYAPMHSVIVINPIKEGIISKPIKTSQNDRQSSTISADRRECGYAVKVRGSSPKIRQGQNSRSQPVSGRPGKVKTGR